MDTAKTTFASNLKKLRQEHSLSQKEFGESIGVSAMAISSYENETKSPSIDTVYRIAQNYCVSIDWLCGVNKKNQTSKNIVTYSELIELLMELEEVDTTSVSFNLKNYPDHFMPCYTLLCEIDDKHIVEFYEEWKDILSIRSKSSSGEKLYELWKKDILERFNFPLENARQRLIETELPFN